MSRVGKKPITVPKGVDVIVKGGTVSVKGPKGSLELELLDAVQAKVEDAQVLVELVREGRRLNRWQGLFRSLIQNMVTGVTEGFQKQLELIGVGYRAAVKGNNLDLQLGFSHPTEVPIPDGIAIKVEKNIITVEGSDKQSVGQFAASVRALRPPEPYQGKGIRYVGEYVRRKAGKAAAKK